MAEVRPRFAEYDKAADRFDHLVRATVHCYRSGEAWLHAAYRERERISLAMDRRDRRQSPYSVADMPAHPLPRGGES